MNQAADVEAASTPKGLSDATPTQFNFFRLPRPIQDRLLASIKGSGAPRPLAFERAGAASGYGWLVLFVVFASVVLCLAVLGYGELGSTFAIQSPLLGVVYGLCGGLSAASLAAYAWTRGAQLRYPYPLGVYLFPVGVVVAKDEHLRVHRLTELQSVQLTGRRLRLQFSDASFTFALPTTTDEEQLQATLSEFVSKLADAVARKDRRALAALDPIRDSGFSNPLSSADAIGKGRDQRVWRYGLALILGATIGVLLLLARNKLGERELYQKALAANSVPAYSAYLARGGNRPEVAEILLPRAELAELKERGSSLELSRYAEAHPDSKIRTEITLALREALLRDLTEVQKAGTLSALEQFKVATPAHAVIEPELKAARAQVFAAALAQYKAKARPDERIQQVFEALLRHSELHGPTVLVRFRREVPKSAERSDSAIRRSAYYAGKASLPSQYFTKEYAEPRERVAGQALLEALQKHFSPEILRFELGPGLEGEGELPKVEVPTLFVTHTTEMSGGYTTNRPRGVFVGLGLMILADFVVPQSEASYRMRYSVWLPPDINEISRESLTPEQVYERNAAEGFARFNAKLLAELLPPQ